MTTWYAQNSSVNINSVHEWNDVANGSGNWLTWANLATDDILCANTKTAILINVDFTCLRISTQAEAAGNAGGGFAVADARTITANILAGSSICLTTSESGYTLIIIGTITGGTSSSKYGLYNPVAVDIHITGAITGGSATSASGISNNDTGNLVITGNLLGGSSTNTYGIYQAGNGNVTINGNITGGSDLNGYGINCMNANTTLTINSGNLVAGANKNTAPIIGVGRLVYNPGAGNYIQLFASGSVSTNYSTGNSNTSEHVTLGKRIRDN